MTHRAQRTKLVKRLLAVFVIILLVSAGYSEGFQADDEVAARSVSGQANGDSANATVTRVIAVDFTDVYRVVDREAGVVCYVYEHIPDAGGSIDCLPIGRTRLRALKANGSISTR